MRPGKAERSAIRLERERKAQARERAALVSSDVIPTSRFAERAILMNTGGVYHRWAGMDQGGAKPQPKAQRWADK